MSRIFIVIKITVKIGWSSPLIPLQYQKACIRESPYRLYFKQISDDVLSNLLILSLVYNILVIILNCISHSSYYLYVSDKLSFHFSLTSTPRSSVHLLYILCNNVSLFSMLISKLYIEPISLLFLLLWLKMLDMSGLMFFSKSKLQVIQFSTEVN